MKPRVVLTTAPVSMQERYGRFQGAANTEPSFGLICLAASAKQVADVQIVESAANDMSVDEAAKSICRTDPNIVGITATTMGIPAAGALAERIKAANKDTVVILGGCHASALPEETLAELSYVDLIVMGEGEDTLVDIIKRWHPDTRIPPDIPGTASKNGETITRNPVRPLIEDLDSLPLPAWSLLPGFPAAFRPSPARIKRWPCASVVFTRGCPNTCTFCDRSVFGRVCRAYSPTRAVEIVKDLRNNYGVKELLIEDDTFIVSKQRIRKFCELLMSERIDITWSCLGRADRVDPDLLSLMHRAGCWHISYGIESGDAGILESVNKHLDLEQIRQAIEWTVHAGIRTKGFFMVGFPGETHETLRKTADVAKSLPLDEISVMQLSPFPGSELYATASELGTFERNWKKMNTLNTVFVPHGLTVDDLENARARLLREFYLQPRVIIRQLKHVATSPRLMLTFLRGLPSFFRLIGAKR